MTDQIAPLVYIMGQMARPRPDHRYIFAYDLLMDESRIRERCPGVQFVTTARLRCRRWFVNEHGVPSVKRERDSVVYGVVWEISEAEQALLEAHLGVPAALDRYGAFARDRLGRLLPVEFYATYNIKPGVAEPIQLVQVLALARLWRFPRHYIDQIETWALPALDLQVLLRPAC